ncbi:hypothetical protein [Burkholderia ubonensis]|uniref:hypothetical protein n=1 Tax=Burkholderia ubonensis TaxID=101571 RepID=UPI0012F864BC|nr:hypothetical protein [Burkholderia ubonensis]
MTDIDTLLLFVASVCEWHATSAPMAPARVPADARAGSHPRVAAGSSLFYKRSASLPVMPGPCEPDRSSIRVHGAGTGDARVGAPSGARRAIAAFVPTNNLCSDLRAHASIAQGKRVSPYERTT